MEASNFFSRLLRQPKPNAQVVEVDDIGEFDKAWRAVQDTLEHPDERQLTKGIHSTEIPKHLRHIVDALVHESNRVDEETLGSCMEYFVNHDLLAHLERLSEKDRPHGIKSEVLKALNNLIVLLSDRFLVQNAVHRPLRRLLRSCIGDTPSDEGDVHGSAKALGAAGVERHGEEVEGDLVDLMCVLCSRMRAYPPLLLIFFHDKEWLQPNNSGNDDTTETTTMTPTKRRPLSLSTRPSTSAANFEFLLFSYLLRFIHREGKSGDFARAGLLFLFDIAFLPTEQGSTSPRLQYDDSLLDARSTLAEYILDGDFTDVMAAGLGAVWSLLPSKLRVPTLGELASDEGDEDDLGTRNGGMILGSTGQRLNGNEENEARLSTDEDVRGQMGMLLKLFGFLQDIMTRCTPEMISVSGVESTTTEIGLALVDSALDSLQSSFLENVLYPSILECSPLDGSSVGVITYLDILLSNLDDGPLVTRLLDYLLNIGECTRDEERFTLKDLILDNIQSGQVEASSAALRLLRTLMSEHCTNPATALLSTIAINDEIDSEETHFPGGRDGPTETEMYGSLIERLDPSITHLDQSTGYASYLADTHSTIQNDRCFQLLQLLNSDHELHLPMPSRHRVLPHDNILRSLLECLGRLLCQTPDENVALTGAIISLALCPYRSLEGWLTNDEGEVDPWSNTKAGDADPFTTHNQGTRSEPAIYQILRHLVQQTTTFRARIPQFDALLTERRQGLLYTDNLDEALNVMLDVSAIPMSPTKTQSTPTPGTMTPIPKKKGMMGTLASYLTPKTRSSPTPTASPSTPGPVTPQRQLQRKTTTTQTMSPFKAHYDTIAGKEVQAVPSPVRTGVWSPSVGPIIDDQTSSDIRPGSALASNKIEEDRKEEGRKMSLSTILDNCIILEEFVKELIGVINARRALGIDSVSF